MHKTAFDTADGFTLHATTYGDAALARAGVLIAPAMGVEQHYYAAFAQWLVAQGCFVVTFDYRGMGASRPAAYRRSLRGFHADVLTWATRDCAAAVDFIAHRIADKPLLWIGHSLGGQILALVPNRERVSAMATIATGSGYWRENSAQLRRVVWWLWFVLVPLSLRVFGYFPGRRLRKVGDLPHGVMAQWRRWCLHPEYLVGAEGEAMRQRYAQVRTPILSLSFTDDEYMSERNTASIHGFYVSAPREMQRIAPASFGLSRIGHFGFFRRTLGEVLWPRLAPWLDRHAAAAPMGGSSA